MEKIISIEDVYNIKTTHSHAYFDGYKIKTSNNTYWLLIENGQYCCESWGYFSSSDNVQEFVKSTLKEVKLFDTSLNAKKLIDNGRWINEKDCMFVNFETNKGTLQFVVYNQHNGYYGHEVLLLKNENKIIEKEL